MNSNRTNDEHPSQMQLPSVDETIAAAFRASSKNDFDPFNKWIVISFFQILLDFLDLISQSHFGGKFLSSFGEGLALFLAIAGLYYLYKIFKLSTAMKLAIQAAMSTAILNQVFVIKGWKYSDIVLGSPPSIIRLLLISMFGVVLIIHLPMYLLFGVQSTETADCLTFLFGYFLLSRVSILIHFIKQNVLDENGALKENVADGKSQSFSLNEDIVSKNPRQGSWVPKMLMAIGGFFVFIGLIVGDQSYQSFKFGSAYIPFDAGRTVNWTHTTLGAILLFVGAILYSKPSK